MGNQPPLPPRQKIDWIKEGLIRVEHEGGNRLTPKVYVDDATFEKLCLPWKDAIIMKLLGKKIGYGILRDRLKLLWKLQAAFEMMDVGNGLFMVKFNVPEDWEKVLCGGPWMIFDHYLVVSQWSPDIISPASKVERTMVWIIFLGLCYDEGFLLGLASNIGRPIKFDVNTTNAERG